MNTKTMEKKGCRPVRVHLAMEDGPLPRSIKQVLGALRNNDVHQFVQKIDDADLVIFGNLRSIEQDYQPSRTYAFLQALDMRQTMPPGVKIIPLGSEVVSMIELIHEVWVKLEPLQSADANGTPETPNVSLRPDALRILVIDDLLGNIASAKRGLAGHRLTTVTGYESAMDILKEEKFDVVLTDLHLPMSSQMLSNKAFKLGELVEYGLLLMIEAAHRGARYVAVVTDLGHHDDPFSAAFDHFGSHKFTICDAKCRMLHAPMTQAPDNSWVKDWSRALDILMEKKGD